jgi:predicted phosphodiesterase
MTMLGILSDVHGNLEAFLEAVRFLELRRVDRILCAGDLVGYNSWPNECVELAARLGVGAVAGNHDLIAIGRLGTERCSDKAAFGLRRTRVDLEPRAARYLAGLADRRVEHGGERLIFHGSFDDPTEYLRTPANARRAAERACAEYPELRVAFFGHTHAQGAFAVAGAEVAPIAPDAPLVLEPGRVYFVNPGSIDASRKPEGERVAEFAVYDDDAQTIEFHHVPYDDARVEREARAAGYRMGLTDGWIHEAGRLVASGRRMAERRIDAAARKLGVARR